MGTDSHSPPGARPCSHVPMAPSDMGWYLYGITSRATAGAVTPSSSDTTDGGTDGGVGSREHRGRPPEFLNCGELAAIVRRVSLEEFRGEDSLGGPGNDESLEAIVRDHNSLVAAVHREGPILPAKFGLVYAHRHDLEMALENLGDALMDRLQSLDGRDEWAVHVYAEHPSVRERIAAADPALRQLRQELSAATPGRAYFLERKLADRLTLVTQQVLSELARTAYDRLSAIAIESRLSSSPHTSGGTEILRAAFLVEREDSDRFLRELGAFADSDEYVSCEYSGPWPPYSFALVKEEDLS